MSVNSENLMFLEASLRNFFLKEKQGRARNLENFVLMKYRGLSLKINDDKDVTFSVIIAGFEAQFRVSDGEKILGALGGDEKIVQKWYLIGENKIKVADLARHGTDQQSDMVKEKVHINTDKKSIFDRPHYQNE